MKCDRRGLLAGATAALATPAWARDPADLIVSGRLVQGGFVMGRTWPRAMIFVDGEALTTASVRDCSSSGSTATRRPQSFWRLDLGNGWNGGTFPLPGAAFHQRA